MGFFSWFLLFILTFWIITRFFGRYIFKFLATQLLKQVAKNAEKQARAYQENYESQAFRENIHVDEDLKVSKPKYDEKRKVDPDDIAEDIEFEEL